MAPGTNDNAELSRLREARESNVPWRRWGPYLSERQWGTVREDYSPYGTAWDSFPFEMARSRAYRWGEDGIMGISDDKQFLCFSLALWNGADRCLKDRIFGLTNSQGNHGEDVKEYYFYLENLPSHAYMSGLYRYPQRAFPYDDLIATNARRTKLDPEYELIDTGIFNDNKYFDVMVEYAKAGTDDILIKITATNRGNDPAELHLVPTFRFRNTWSWDIDAPRPEMTASARDRIALRHPWMNAPMHVYCEPDSEVLYSENETNFARLYGGKNTSAFVKDAFDDYVVHGRHEAVNPGKFGTQAAVYRTVTLAGGESCVMRLRLTESGMLTDPFGPDFESIVAARSAETEQFFNTLVPFEMTPDEHLIRRRALAGLLWSKQFYYYIVRRWLDGDPTSPPPPASRLEGRNRDWRTLYADDVLSMPDTWEFPWFAAWDLAFHVVTLAAVDPDYAKSQLALFTREWYMHPDGELPAYEWAFDDINPPVHAWATYRVAQLEKVHFTGIWDRSFLERIFHKLLMNFTFWVNREDPQGHNVFGGGFLGLDNVGVVDRSALRDEGIQLGQADATSWMGVYSLNMLRIALDLAQENWVYADIASKFFEHFLSIASAINGVDDDAGLWDDQDGFYYDVLRGHDGKPVPMKVRSVVGLLPLLAVETIERDVLDHVPSFTKRMEWFINDRPELAKNTASPLEGGAESRRLLAIVQPERLRRILARMLDEEEFLSPHGIRSLSKYHLDHPYEFTLNGATFRISYQPAESTDGTFGGNSNWRGPVWFPVNYLIVEALQKFHYYYGDDFLVECPTGSGTFVTLWQVATEISNRLISIFTKDGNGMRPVFGGQPDFQHDPHWHDNILFYEYYHGDNGAGLGASHQTGWSALVAKLIRQTAQYRGNPPEIKSAPETLTSA